MTSVETVDPFSGVAGERLYAIGAGSPLFREP